MLNFLFGVLASCCSLVFLCLVCLLALSVFLTFPFALGFCFIFMASGLAFLVSSFFSWCVVLVSIACLVLLFTLVLPPCSYFLSFPCLLFSLFLGIRSSSFSVVCLLPLYLCPCCVCFLLCVRLRFPFSYGCLSLVVFFLFSLSFPSWLCFSGCVLFGPACCFLGFLYLLVPVPPLGYRVACSVYGVFLFLLFPLVVFGVSLSVSPAAPVSVPLLFSGSLGLVFVFVSSGFLWGCRVLWLLSSPSWSLCLPFASACLCGFLLFFLLLLFLRVAPCVLLSSCLLFARWWSSRWAPCFLLFVCCCAFRGFLFLCVCLPLAVLWLFLCFCCLSFVGFRVGGGC